MKNIAVMIKPASSLCNLRCRYCFYAEVSDKRKVRSFGVMEQTVAAQVIRNVFTGLTEEDTVCFAFQGGEPTLAGLDFFRSFIAEVKNISENVRVSYALQTNGTLLDNAWCEFLKEHSFLVGLSLDILPDIHDGNRLDVHMHGTCSQVLHAKALLEKHGVEYNILTVLTNDLAGYPGQVWEALSSQNIQYVQFIPCLGELDGMDSSVVLLPERFASFYTHLFRLWSADYERGKYRSVKLFDDLINLLAFGSRNACGITGQCMPQIVVEADGSVYPCDFYAMDEYCIGNLAKSPIEKIYTAAVTSGFPNRPNETLSLCETCTYAPMCGGGCPRMRREVCGNSDSKQCGYRMFLDNCLSQMQDYAYWERIAR